MGVKLICSVLEIALSTYYEAKARALSARAVRDAELRPQLRALWEENQSVYGQYKHTRVAKKRLTTHSDLAAVRTRDLLRRDFTASHPNEKRVADFTYCSTGQGSSTSRSSPTCSPGGSSAGRHHGP